MGREGYLEETREGEATISTTDYWEENCVRKSGCAYWSKSTYMPLLLALACPNHKKMRHNGNKIIKHFKIKNT